MSLRVEAAEFVPSFQMASYEEEADTSYYLDSEGHLVFYVPPAPVYGPKIQYTVDQLLQLRRVDAVAPFDPEWTRELDIDVEPEVVAPVAAPVAALVTRSVLVEVVSPKPTRRNASKQRGTKQVKENKAQLAAERALLHKSKNRWNMRSVGSSDSDKAAQNITGLLNKLSASNLARLVEQFVALVMHASILRRAVELLFEKAVGEPGFSLLYAKFTVAAATIFATQAPADKDESEDFGELMKTKVDENEAELFIDFDKKRAVGISKFVGDLYNVNFLLPKIVHDRVFGMFSIIDQEKPDEHHVELLCKFISTIGKSLEAQDVTTLDQYFEVLEMIMQNQEISSRARFMIMDLQDLRENSWAATFTKQPTKTPSACSAATTAEMCPSASSSSEDETQAPPMPKPRLSADQIDKKSTALLAEFFSGQDLKEALSCLQELDADNLLPDIIYKAITMGLDRKAVDRELVVRMLNASGEAKIISTENLERGFMQVLELIEDLEIDIPHASSMVSSMLGGVMAKKLLPLSFLDQALPFFPPNEQPAVRIIDVLSAIHKASDTANMRAVYEESASGWSVQQYVEEEDVQGSILLQAICC